MDHLIFQSCGYFYCLAVKPEKNITEGENNLSDLQKIKMLTDS